MKRGGGGVCGLKTRGRGCDLQTSPSSRPRLSIHFSFVRVGELHKSIPSHSHQEGRVRERAAMVGAGVALVECVQRGERRRLCVPTPASLSIPSVLHFSSRPRFGASHKVRSLSPRPGLSHGRTPHSETSHLSQKRKQRENPIHFSSLFPFSTAAFASSPPQILTGTPESGCQTAEKPR